MLFHRIPAAALGPDPVTNPEDVPRAAIFRMRPVANENSGSAAQALALAAEDETAAVTVSVYAEIEQESEAFINTRPAQADRKWRLLGSITGVAGEVVVGNFKPLPGNIYVRVTAGNGVGVIALLGPVA